MDKIHEYFFNRKYVEWKILDFLTECEERYFKKKIDLYIKSLKNIIKSDMRKTKREKARTLLDRYKKAILIPLGHWRTSRFFCRMFKTSCRPDGMGRNQMKNCEGGTRPDRREARTWREECNRKKCAPSVHIETNHGNVSGTTNGGTFFAGLERDKSKKRKYQENSSEDANSDESIPEKKRQSVSNIRSFNEANEIVKDTILITDRMFTERKEEMVYNPIETELTPNEKKETLINTHDEDIIDNIVLRDMYLDTQREIRGRISQKDASSPF
ncbi:1477_t:CDS:2 [Paraglomus occultum]|uniref:1477_t:CDS:1 n=1 Tax=Paraglomus occultum TaxID=144539 RepID=A0A9N9CBV3_9GLOM|nr:1477_t:CDS:2 [Paraglomus occultum]